MLIVQSFIHQPDSNCILFSFQIPATTTRILLNHFKWDKEKLMERFYDGDQEKLFKDAHVINPFRKPSTVNKPKVWPAYLTLNTECYQWPNFSHSLFLDQKIWNGRLRDLLFVVSSQCKCIRSSLVGIYVAAMGHPILCHTSRQCCLCLFLALQSVFVLHSQFYHHHCPSIRRRGEACDRG